MNDNRHPRRASWAGRTRRPDQTTAGSALIAAMLFAAIIAISLTSYIKLALNSIQMADRSYYQNAAINLAEVGIEEAVFSYNKLDDVSPALPGDAWSPYGWTLGTDTATRTLAGFALGPGVTGVVKVHCTYFAPAFAQKPVVVARATLNFPTGPATSKFLEVRLRKRALFPRGMVVRETIRAVGGSLSLDSWDSQDDGNPATPIVAYSTDPAVRHANATLATLSSAPEAIDIGNGKVYGYIATAPGGTVAYGPTAVLSGDFASTSVDTDRISHDFDVTAFPMPTSPTAAWINITTSLAPNAIHDFPRPGDTPAADGNYYYNFASGANIDLNTGAMNVNAKVILRLENHAGVMAMKFGSGGISIISGGALKVYTNGNVSMSGTGFLSNGNAEPSTCMFYGTNTTAGGQTFVLKGNGHTSVCLYAPEANISMSGGGTGGDFYGAIVGRNVEMNGNTRFHYDEALARLVHTGNPYGIEKWRELQTSDERATVASLLSF